MSLEKDFINEMNDRLLLDKKRVEDELKRLGKRVGSTENYETYFNDMGTGDDENATEVEEYTDNLAVEDSLEKQLREIDTAIERIIDGSYGYCENCKKDISIERLKAFPAARICLDCK